MADCIDAKENLDVSNNFIQKLTSYKLEVVKIFNELNSKLNERKQQILTKLAEIQTRYEQPHAMADTAIQDLEKNRNKILDSLTSVNNFVSSTTTDSILQKLEVDIGVWRARIEILSEITVDLDTTLINNAINNLGSVSVVVNSDYETRKRPFMIVGKIGTGKGEFNCPRGVAVNTDDNIYVADKNNKRIQVFSIHGSYLREFGSSKLSSPHSLCISNDEVYITDNESNSLFKFQVDGNFIKKTGSQGCEDGKFYSPKGICMSNHLDALYVCDCLNHRIQIFNVELEWQKSLGYELIKYPTDVNRNGNLICLLANSNTFHILSHSGKYLKTVQNINIELNSAYYFNFDNYNNILISSDNAIKIFNPRGHLITMIGNELLEKKNNNDNNNNNNTYCSNACGIAITKENIIVTVCGGKSHSDSVDRLQLF